MRNTALLTLSLGLWFLAGCQTPLRPSHELRRSQPLLGTFVVISAAGSNRASLSSAIDAGFEEIRRIDSLMSIHRADTELARVNRLAGEQSVPVSEELFAVLSTAQQIAAETEGSFDITIRPVAELWGFIWKEYRMPTAAERAEALSRVGHQFVELDEARRTVRFLKPGLSVDLGGIAKGYAVDQAMAALHRCGISNALVRAGGDLRASGRPPDQSAWPVQLEDPEKRGRRLQIHLADAALSTSGSYENFFVVEGRRYSHLLDPRNGLPVQDVAACTVVAPTCLQSDAWATACFVYGVEPSLSKFGHRFPMRFVVPDGDDYVIKQTPTFPR